jgi:hypothetical protein
LGILITFWDLCSAHSRFFLNYLFEGYPQASLKSFGLITSKTSYKMADIRTWAEALQAAQSELPDSSDALASMPVVTLPNGQKVQTGTVGALLVNIKSYDEIMGKAPVDERRKQELEEKMSASLQLLKPVGK